METKEKKTLGQRYLELPLWGRALLAPLLFAAFMAAMPLWFPVVILMFIMALVDSMADPSSEGGR